MTTTRVFPVRLRHREREMYQRIADRFALGSVAEAIRFAGKVTITMTASEASERAELYDREQKLAEKEGAVPVP